MKIVTSVILASALIASAVSLSGCSTTANSQPVDSGEAATAPQRSQPATVANELSSMVGQQCTVYLDEKTYSFEGTLKSVTDSWVIIDGMGAKVVNDEVVRVPSETYIPTKSIGYVSFLKSPDKK